MNRKNNSTKREGKIVNQNIKKQTLRQQTNAKLIDDERPSTSGLIFGAQGSLVVEDSVELTDSEDDTDNIPCCMCNQKISSNIETCSVFDNYELGSVNIVTIGHTCVIVHQ